MSAVSASTADGADALDADLEAWAWHLAFERRLSPHTVSAYRSDLSSALRLAARARRGPRWRRSPPSPVREWLAHLHDAGTRGALPLARPLLAARLLPLAPARTVPRARSDGERGGAGRDPRAARGCSTRRTSSGCWRRAAAPRRWTCATGRCSRPPTERGCAPPSWWGSAPRTSTFANAGCACAARGQGADGAAGAAVGEALQGLVRPGRGPACSDAAAIRGASF